MGKKIDLAIVTIMKNEAPYVKEWLDYHILVGVKKFYIYDNDSDDNLHDVLRPYIEQGIVEYTFYPGQEQMLPAFNECVQRHRDDVEWLAIIDADEFIVPVKTKTIQQTLRDYAQYPAVGINWVMYDSNGHVDKPRGGVLENYTRCRKWFRHEPSAHIKSIVQPSKVINVLTSHYSAYQDGALAVDENKNIIDKSGKGFAFTDYASVKKLRINHYWSKSYEETLKKIERGNADSWPKRKLEECKQLWDIKYYTYDYNMYKYVVKLHGHFFRETVKYMYYKILGLYYDTKKTDLYKLIKKSGYFDKKWYKKTYPEMARSSLDPIYHYLLIGWKKAYSTSPRFDSRQYLENNPDIKRANMDPLLHFLQHGIREGRKAYPVVKEQEK